MTKLPPPEQWALCKMDEMEVAEMIEEHIDYYAVDEDGNRRSVHLPMPFVRHYMRRHDGVLPMIVAYATMPLVLGDGSCWRLPASTASAASSSSSRMRCAPSSRSGRIARRSASGQAIKFLFDEWLVDVATDRCGKAMLVAAALSIIERSLLDNRPCFFVTAGRRGNGKTTVIQMLIMAAAGDRRRPRRGRPTRRSGARR